MLFTRTSRNLRIIDPTSLAKLASNFGDKGACSVLLFHKRLTQGI